ISMTVRNYHEQVANQVTYARDLYHLENSKRLLGDDYTNVIEKEYKAIKRKITNETEDKLIQWDKQKEKYEADTFSFYVRDKEITIDLTTKSLSGLKIPKVKFPSFTD